MDSEVEDIPGEDLISRHLDSPHKYTSEIGLIWPCVFQFNGGHGESVVWRKYKPEIGEVHQLGCERQKVKRGVNSGWTYEGAITSATQAIRGLRSRGHGFQVLHVPTEGKHHAEISYAIAAGQELKKADKTALKGLIKEVFEEPEQHTCLDL